MRTQACQASPRGALRSLPRRGRTVRRAALALLLTGVGATPAAAAEGGLVIFPDVPTLVLLIVFFLVLVAPMQRLIFAPLLRVLDERVEQIDGARARAAEVVREADEVEGRHARSLEEARERAEDDRAARVDDAKRENQSTLAAARESAEEQVEQARREIRAAVDEARQGLRDEAQSLGRLVAERLLGRNLS